MDSNSRFRSKMSKVENLLLIINNEVDSAVKLLNYLKEHSFEMVEALRKIPSSSAFLKEFLEINSFLLKYLDFLTEINCKFEILQTSGKEEKTGINFQHSTYIAGLKSSKSESDVNFNDSSIASIILHENNTVDYFTDIGSCNSTETSCADLTQIENKSVNAQKVQNKNLVVADKEKEQDTSTIKLQSADAYPDDQKQILYDGVKVHSPEPAANELVEKINGHKNGLVLAACSFTQTEEKSFEASLKNECYPPVKNSINVYASNKVECKTPSVIEENSVTEISYATVSDMRRFTEIEVVTESSDTSLSLVSAGQLERCNDKLFEIKALNISRKIGEEYKVVVEHIVSPSEFYVYILHDELYSFAELESKLKLVQKDQSFHKRKESKEYLSQVFGKYALYYSKCDEIWCRAKITDWRVNQKDDLVYIFLLDYGESKCVILDDLQEMPDCFKMYPAYVQRCHLSGIYPTELNSCSKTLAWSKAASEKMKCLVDTAKKLKIKIAPEDIHHPAKSLPVTLWLIDQNNSCVNDLLIKFQHAQLAKNPETGKDSFSEGENLEAWNPMREDFESYLNSYDLDVKDPAAVIYGYVGKDYDRICKHFAKTGQCFKGESCKKEHIFYNPLGFTTDKEEVYKNAVNALPLPEPKSVISVQVTCILSSNMFCCIRDESVWTSEDETLQSLVQYMNCNENIRDMKKLLIPPSVGQLVIAQYSQDSSWYRAKILESQPESDQYSVLFVDYGNKEMLPLSRIRAIEGRYLHLPFQAIQCYIFGITHNPKASVKECMDYLNGRITEDKVSLEVVAALPGDHPRLLVNVFDQNGENIAADLITKEYAIFKKELLVNRESTAIPG